MKKFRIGGYVVPKGTKNIVQIEDMEMIDNVMILYTSDGSFCHKQVDTLEQVYEKKLTSDLRGWLKKILIEA
jgi:hypothetical protein